MQGNVARIRATRQRVLDSVRGLGYSAADSHGNFFWMDCGERGGEAVYQRMRSLGILVRYFETEGLRGGVRVSIGTDADMDRFLAALAG